MASSEDRPAPEGGDAALALLYAQPFAITRPAVQTLPFVFASPHSGRLYPDGLAAASRLDALTLRRSEDAFVDELFAAAPALGAPLIAARFPRAYCDANRGPAELDTAMFSGPLGMEVEAPTPRVTAGLGVIPRIVRDGAEIYRRKLDPAEAKARLDMLYRPYHAALAALVEDTIARFGMAVVVDCHSMPSALSVPDVVLGDRYGASAPAALTTHAAQAFTDAGFTLARNTPYAGGYTTLLYGKGVAGCHALQIEINRSLYLHEATIQRRVNFDAMKGRVTRVITQLVRINPSALERLPLAAE
jgi:N-formylglutamate amidohydrolase